MAKGKGEGSIRKRKDGRWEGRYTVGRDPKTGKLIQQSVYGKTRAEVKEALLPILTSISKGIYVQPGKYTVGEWLTAWLWDVKQGKIKPKTFGWYEELIQNHIKETGIYSIKLSDLRRFHVQKWVDDKVKAECSVRTIIAAYGIIRNACNDAVRLGVLESTYADKVILPKEKSAEIQILSPEDQKLFMEAIRGHRMEAAFLVSLTTGIREGELAALGWNDFNEADEILKIHRNAIRVNEYDEKTRGKIGTKVIIQDSPKSDAGFRELPLIPLTVEALRRHRIRQKEEIMKNRLLYVDNGLIFCNEVGMLYDPKTFYSTLRKVCDQAGLKRIKFHALRHTFATRALEKEISEKAIQGFLGHETEAMTRHYTHLLKAQKRKEMNKLKDAFT